MDVIAGTGFGIEVNSQKDLNDPFVRDAAGLVQEIFTQKGLFMSLASEENTW